MAEEGSGIDMADVDWESYTTLSFVVPYGIYEGRDEYKTRGRVAIIPDAEEVDYIMSLEKVICDIRPELQELTGFSVVEQAPSTVDISHDRYGLRSMTKVFVKFRGVQRGKDLLLAVLPDLNEFAMLIGIRQRASWAIPVARRDVLTYDTAFYENGKNVGSVSGMFGGIRELEMALETHFQDREAFFTIMAKQTRRVWVNEIWAAYQELHQARVLPALTHLSVGFELLVNAAMQACGLVGADKALKHKCTSPEALPRILGGSLESSCKHGALADDYVKVRDLRNTVVHQGKLPPWTTWEQVVEHFDRVARLSEFIGEKVAEHGKLQKQDP